MRKVLISFIVLFMVTTISSPTKAQSKPEASSTLGDIPSALVHQLNQGRYKEGYINNMLSTIRSRGTNNKYLEQKNIDELKKRDLQSRRNQKLKEAIVYDSNLDGEISKDEVLNYFTQHKSGYAAEYRLKQVERIMQADQNEDGVLTMHEVAMHKIKGRNFGGKHYKSIEDMLKLDPNKDGKLTIRELTKLAEKAFDTVDTNKDGKIDKEEYQALRTEQRKNRNSNGVQDTRRHGLGRGYNPERCGIPKAKPDEKVIFVSVHGGLAVPSVTVAGQEVVTEVIPVEIAQNATDNMYVILSSTQPMIWKLSGNTEKISRLVVAGSKSREGVRSGVTGISKELVTFSSQSDCGFSSAWEPVKETFIENAIFETVGKQAMLQRSQHSMTALRIKKDEIDFANAELLKRKQARAPKGFDPESWKQHIRYVPGGFISIDLNEVTSDVATENYKVPPKWAGISRLIYEKSLVPYYENGAPIELVMTHPTGKKTTVISVEHINLQGPGVTLEISKVPQELHIVKNIPYLPAGLGPYSTNFILSEGLDVPQGNLKENCILLEKTGKSVSGVSHSCRKAQLKRSILHKIKGQKAIEYHLNKEANLALYRHQANSLPEGHRKLYDELFNVMKQDKMPTEVATYEAPYGLGTNLYVLKKIPVLDKTIKEPGALTVPVGGGAAITVLSGMPEDIELHSSCMKKLQNEPLFKITPKVFAGIAISYEPKDTHLLVKSVFKKGPADLAGLRIGDKIISIDGEKVNSSNKNTVVKRIRGEIGTPVTVTFIPSGRPSIEKKTVTLTRDVVQMSKRPLKERVMFPSKIAPKYDWEYLDFLVLGKSIKPEALVWENDRKLVNRKTGKSINFASPPCFNFIFSEEGIFQDTVIGKSNRPKTSSRTQGKN